MVGVQDAITQISSLPYFFPITIQISLDYLSKSTLKEFPIKTLARLLPVLQLL